MVKLSKSNLSSARSANYWSLANQVIYELCAKYPKHVKDEEIIAKVWIIGRTYAAAVERRKNAKKIGDKFYEEDVAPAFRRSSIDGWLASTIKNPGAQTSISVHKKLVDLLKSLTDHEKRSFASKYLHFHQPNAYFIYDSRARKAITKLVPRLTSIADIKAVTFDTEYKDFVRRCLWLRDHILKKFGVFLTPRQIDNLLLRI